MWLYKFTKSASPLARLYWKGELIGDIEEIPKTGPLIVCANHSSFIDPWLLGFLFPRLVRYLVNAEWFHKSRVWHTLFTSYGCIPQARSPMQTIQDACAFLERGEVLGVFPEGRISHDGKLQRVRSGAARMAHRSGVPVLPVGIQGAYESLPRSRRLPRPGTIRLNVGRKLSFNGSPSDGKPTLRELQEFNDALHASLCDLVLPSARPDAR